MELGTSQTDITPETGVELSGFAARIQPSTGVLDPLFARACYLTHGREKLLWLHCDLVGFDRAIVRDFRRWASASLGLREDQVMLSATHTHSGPCTIHLQEAGTYDAGYVEWLHGRLQLAARKAAERTEPVALVSIEGGLELTMDRRKTSSAHIDQRVVALGFRRDDGTFAGVVVNYAMHPVALGSSNRLISADVPGQAARVLACALPGQPVVLVTNGACANLNPPAENVPFEQVQAWGAQIAAAVAPQLKTGASDPSPRLQVATRSFELPLDTLDADGVKAFAERAAKHERSLAEWGDKYLRVVEHWRSSLLADLNAGHTNGHRYAELFAVAVGDTLLVGANAEVFSEFTDWLRQSTGKKVCLIGYANGDIGYLPTRAAFAEGGYEVEVAHLFYGGFRPRPGSLELLAAEATRLLRRL